MKTFIKNKKGVVENTKTKFSKINVAILAVLSLTFFLTSCYKEPWGSDGLPGKAYLALTWVEEEPSYLDVGTSAIPEYFYWDEYYRITSGYYNFYYEGDVWTGNRWAFYSWEIDYEIWTNTGESGEPYYNGRDGADTYFTIECSPYGPYVSEDYKGIVVEKDYRVIEDTGDTIIIEKEKEEFTMRVTYKKVEKRNRK